MSANTSKSSGAGKASILVVDDRADKLLGYEVILAELNQDIVCVRSGKEALRRLLKQDFAAIILDVNMPDMDGFETAALIRQRQGCETTPIIFVSAVNDTLNHISRGYSLGAVDYILTPIVPDILRAKIAVFVDLFKKTEQIKRQGEERENLIREQAAAEAARAEAERQSAAKDRFLAMLSHELRTPLTPVLASALTLEYETDLPASIRESLQLIRRNVELEARLIDDLLDLTRISKGKVQLNFEAVDAHRLLQNALKIYQTEIDRKNLALNLDLAAEKAYLQADPARLQQIFWNLINNAVKFTPPKGQITISTTNRGDCELRVQIADTGLGIEPDALPKIFNAFEQGTRTQSGGLGLGLAICKTLVEGHKGAITAESSGRNQGAKFTLTFPTCDKPGVASVPQVADKAAERRTMRVLLVEDHGDTNQSLTRLLRRRGYQVESAVDVKSALELTAKHQFDVLVSDLGLPDGSGHDVMRALTSSSERPLCGIALTGFGMEEDVRKSREAGFKHHLVKPIDVNNLDTLIQESANHAAERQPTSRDLS